ncbi:hypothetical protein [Aestuariimicrobium kwangyangense]|uniref:hypothetical protein n=1 Tax=Aestuariimicrobium kwangyangense TaxID=396389 RepID=UPI0003B3C61E|nr:hypothetical protein [Aestuariimicrobium kwangyangense]
MSEDTLLLGPAPRPQTSEALTAALRSAVAALLPRGVQGVDRATIQATLEGSTISNLTVDLTGVEVPSVSDDLLDVRLPQVETRSSEPATISHATLSANPITVAGARVSLSGQVNDLPALWVETTQGQAGLQVLEPKDPARPVSGEGQASVAKAELQAAALRVGQQFAKQMGVTLDDLTLDLVQVSPQQIKFGADARVKKGFVGASAQVSGSATLDQAMNVTLSNIEVGSKNPIINALLGAMKGRVERYNGKTIRINERLPRGVRLTHAEFQVTDQVVVKGRIG